MTLLVRLLQQRALISEPAMKAGVIVKFSQNVLIGVAAFFLSIVWAIKKGKATGEKVSPMVIWERFPKFVLGFIAASIVFSFILHIDTVGSNKISFKRTHEMVVCPCICLHRS